jgi:uncharacterized protein YigA (DUF484 family)
MTKTHRIEGTLRDTILAEPAVILDDKDVMNALVAATERGMGGNIVDLRGIAMERLEARLDRLELTHRSVIAAAYENLSGTRQVHRAILRLLEPTDFESFVKDLGGPVADALGLAGVRLVLESADPDTSDAVEMLGDSVCIAAKGFVAAYIGSDDDAPRRLVTLRQIAADGDAPLYGEKAGLIRSEACIVLDLGEGRLPGMLLLGSEDPHQFSPMQGTDLLAFLGGVFERSMRRWLA